MPATVNSCRKNISMERFTERDKFFMRTALECADRVKGYTFPNPAVGAVLVKKNKIVGKGATAPWGGDHAEVQAIKAAGSNAGKSTLYLTLEPCCHFGKTPPCTDAVIGAGIAKVYIGIQDPNPLVNGKGIKKLRGAEISVRTGLLKDDVRKHHEAYCWWIQKKTPWVALKMALTLDGRIADKLSNSQWITSKESRTRVHDLRRQHAGIAVGAGTFKVDNPRLTVRHGKGKNPVRFIFTSSQNLPIHKAFLDDLESVRSIMVISGDRPREKKRLKSGVEVWHTGAADYKKSMRAFFSMAYDEHITSILFEGGAKIASFLMENHLVNRLYLFYGNKIVGGGPCAMQFEKGLNINTCYCLADLEIRQLKDNIFVTGIPNWK
ncbi:MAG: bifunctional diaminohydroxyphosphoribosylaminopyrimidine deaminase/5-amino-6-(5-phosphoribosylamino)uracil reductase RibD [Chitinivibrionales bacterium]|nr:bifunctional diaminohydroxyphosphoribosylaminopyrimidine deaminase/5-amino-6-(5-phosphoribosylamino)uracil reductase RibD [Chitinivibrionales bacterium]